MWMKTIFIFLFYFILFYFNFFLYGRIQLLEQKFYTLSATYIQDRLQKSQERKYFIQGCHFWLNGYETRDISGNHKSQQQKVSKYCMMYKFFQYQKFSFPVTIYLNLQRNLCSGAFQLLQMQEDMRRQFKMGGGGTDNDIESHIRLNKDMMMNSLWKLNVVDIEVTLLHVCEMVSLTCL